MQFVRIEFIRCVINEMNLVPSVHGWERGVVGSMGDRSCGYNGTSVRTGGGGVRCSDGRLCLIGECAVI